jgi:acetyltransferase
MAVDSLILNGGRLARLSNATVAALDNLLPPGRARLNPVTFDEDSPPERYGAVVQALLGDAQVDAVMVLHAPSAAVSSSKVAEAVIHAHRQKKGSLLTSWMGGARVADARHLFADAGIPTFETPNQAVDAFLHMIRYRRNQEMLIETPTSVPEEFTPATDSARLMVDHYLAAGRNFLSGREAMSLLAAYGIASAQARLARTADDAVAVAQDMGFPVALRRAARAAARGVDAGGGGGSVDLCLENTEDVRRAANNMLEPIERHRRAKVQTLIVERMARFPGTHEVMISVSEDPIFGSVISFGHGGVAAEVIGDRAVALPPLNMGLARELISRTRVYRLLRGFGDCPPANIDALCLTLIKVSQMVVELPEIAALEINPVLVDENGVSALDAQILIAPATDASERRLAIRPYPKELEEEFRLPNGRTVMLRPIRPEDEPAHHDFIAQCTADDLRLRFFHLVRRLPHNEMARLTQIDYDREMAFVAVARKPGGGTETLGVVRTFTDLLNDKAEYAILVRSDLKGQRLGWKLMDKIIRYSRSRGTRRIVGLVLADNRKMLDLVERLGFTSRRVPDDDVMEVELDLHGEVPALSWPPAEQEAAQGTS